MQRFVRIAAAFSMLAVFMPAATLERLGMDEMIEKSTAIVRGRVTGQRAAFRGPVIYTYFSVQVLERWKGVESAQVEVAVPGGVARGLTQAFSGVPKLTPGDEYVFFLWTGKSGVTQIIGLSQGVFSLRSDGNGGVTATRAASTEAMLDSRTGRVVEDEQVRFRLSDLRTRVNGVTASRGDR